MEFLSPLDTVFLAGETREHPMHLGAIQLYEPPADAPGDFATALFDSMIAEGSVQPMFGKRPGRPLGFFANLTWDRDTRVDLDHHLRRSALPAPGGLGELLTLVSRLHGDLLDRHRPLWEAHLIDGLADGRFAVYLKLHHALIDGMSGRRLLHRTLSTDPADTRLPVPWGPAGPRRDSAPASTAATALNLLREGLHDVLTALPALARVANTVLSEPLTLPMTAAPTVLNVPIGGARTVAVGSWPLERIRLVRKATGSTVNDVVLAMCAGALRAYLAERSALPDGPLTAMVPVAMRSADQADAGGNALGMILADLATHVEDPAERIRLISESAAAGKRILAQLSRTQALALSAALLAPLGVVQIPGFHLLPRVPFNIIISNVPGPTEALYCRGARLDGNFPLGIPFDGQALNITVATNADNLDFGIVGCRRSVPDLPRLLEHLDNALGALETAVGA
ncbi:wax ester/triacylglycerol synthase family O-acyltransferase [Nocardia sp. NPDC005978]|uniref:WS/DGAT/MGAT family O-acyltransferase n=1 Tax=Nocardia sp. NPDC005978 TaxID=3156725 RepID=UPI0033A31032